MITRSDFFKGLILVVIMTFIIKIDYFTNTMTTEDYTDFLAWFVNSILIIFVIILNGKIRGYVSSEKWHNEQAQESFSKEIKQDKTIQFLKKQNKKILYLLSKKYKVEDYKYDYKELKKKEIKEHQDKQNKEVY